MLIRVQDSNYFPTAKYFNKKKNHPFTGGSQNKLNQLKTNEKLKV
jgi:hypothetical protein